jgi:hypothetical protein
MKNVGNQNKETLTMHEVRHHWDGGALNPNIKIIAEGEPNKGGAHTKFTISGKENGPLLGLMLFQNGLVTETGIGGITNEVLIAIVIDRLQGYQAGEFSCRENAVALTHIENGLMWLQKRTRDRIERGVEGRYAK